MSKFLFGTISTMIVSLALVSCSQDQGNDADLQQYIKSLAEQKIQAQTPLPEFKLAQVPKYTLSADYNPFRQAAGQAAGLEQTAAATTPLETFPLSALKFIGTVRIGAKIAAAILAPDGKIYQVHEGTLLGQRKGEVIRITDNSMEISEQTKGTASAGAAPIVFTLDTAKKIQSSSIPVQPVKQSTPSTQGK